MLSGYLRFYERDVPVGTEYVIVREQLLTGQTDMDKVLERLKVLIDSSTPIVVMETVEEVRAVRMVRAACSALNLAVFEWTIATGLARCGTNSSNAIEAGAFDPGGYQTCASKSSVKPEVDRAREEVVKDAVPRVAGVSPIDCLHFLFRQRAGAVVGGILCDAR